MVESDGNVVVVVVCGWTDGKWWKAMEMLWLSSFVGGEIVCF